MVNPGEVLLNAVIDDKPKRLIGLDQKGTWPGLGAPNSPYADDAPPAERHDLTHVAFAKERGKPVVCPHPR
jgi:hypothetical protein